LPRSSHPPHAGPRRSSRRKRCRPAAVRAETSRGPVACGGVVDAAAAPLRPSAAELGVVAGFADARAFVVFFSRGLLRRLLRRPSSSPSQLWAPGGCWASPPSPSPCGLASRGSICSPSWTSSSPPSPSGEARLLPRGLLTTGAAALAGATATNASLTLTRGELLTERADDQRREVPEGEIAEATTEDLEEELSLALGLDLAKLVGEGLEDAHGAEHARGPVGPSIWGRRGRGLSASPGRGRAPHRVRGHRVWTNASYGSASRTPAISGYRPCRSASSARAWATSFGVPEQVGRADDAVAVAVAMPLGRDQGWAGRARRRWPAWMRP
jgi:hypothetical protein